MSLNPGMEQDFRDTIKRCNELTLLLRTAINEAINGDKASIEHTLTEIHRVVDEIKDTVDCDAACLDTFTDKNDPQEDAA